MRMSGGISRLNKAVNSCQRASMAGRFSRKPRPRIPVSSAAPLPTAQTALSDLPVSRATSCTMKLSSLSISHKTRQLTVNATTPLPAFSAKLLRPSTKFSTAATASSTKLYTAVKMPLRTEMSTSKPRQPMQPPTLSAQVLSAGCFAIKSSSSYTLLWLLSRSQRRLP